MLLLSFLRFVTTELPVMFHTAPPRSATVVALPLSVRIAPVSVEGSAAIATVAPPLALSRTPSLPITVESAIAMAALPPRTAKASAAELTLTPEMASTLVAPAAAWKRKPKLPGPEVWTLPPLSAIDPPF